MKVEASQADDDGFARSLVISPQSVWPSVELTVRVANAIDVAGNVRETFSDRVTVARSLRISVGVRGFAGEPNTEQP